MNKHRCYIQGSAAISAQHTFDGDFFSAPMVTTSTNNLVAAEPDYKAFIPPNSLRRMSRMLKMGLTAALKAVQNSGQPAPQVIVTGTGKGSLSDTEKFIRDIEQYQERALNPTPFIQSTYNSVNGLIALQQQSTGYNNTFVHRGFSFENALLDSMLQLHEGVGNTLTGAFEEMTDEHFYIKSRIGFWKDTPTGNAAMFDHNTSGSISGEGATFFMLGTERTPNAEACVTGMKMLYKPSAEALNKALPVFLEQHGLKPTDIDLVITGRNGDINTDHYYRVLLSAHCPATPEVPFKQLCGEHDTAGAFAVWLGAQILKHQQLPDMLQSYATNVPDPIRRILIYNHFIGEQHTFFLLEQA
ncbi:beta-ketoacyl synthase chain length factor [Chitinophaga horti]|uniref:Beta-ketoacyl synthase chain length factor n=1 Tax=Chitinophaga horti TaxID=2920382 RepID=A0ABY6J0R3_9BACT|nr:beta-ketoacyl synthase chain length factor [Chitinophaga horti]UYQ91824.1 beta-ketoacyl synthase chain length factor [Chitinophaga horti]